MASEHQEKFEEKLVEEFDDFGIDIDGNLPILETLYSICQEHGFQPSEIVAEWMTFSIGKGLGGTMTIDGVNTLKKSLMVKQPTKSTKKTKRESSGVGYIHTAATITDLLQEQEEDEIMIQGYAKTPQSKGSQKRLHTTPEDETRSKRLASLMRTPVAAVTARSMITATPSPKYDARTCKGDAVASFPADPHDSDFKWEGTGTKLLIKDFEELPLKNSYKSMFQKMVDRANVIDEMVEALSKQMQSKFSLSDFHSVTSQSQSSITAAGRICCDSLGRLNSQSIVLEGSYETSNGDRIPFDVSNLESFSFFPGQVVAVEGTNPTGENFFCSSFKDGIRLPCAKAFSKDENIDESPFTVYVACGPFSTSDSLSYAPLQDFLEVVERERPDFVVLAGPFVDCKQVEASTVNIDMTFEDKFQEILLTIDAACVRSSSKFALIPSQRDVFHDYVYPQPPFERPSQGQEHEALSEKVLMCSDPKTLRMNDVVLGLTSTDILFHLSREETSSFSPGSSDRLGRLVHHLLKQQTYYPLHPPSEEVNMDYDYFERHCFFPATPDILITPSDLKYFIKDVDGCLCINPGRIVRGQTGGTFAKILVKPCSSQEQDKSIVLDHSFVQIVKI